MDIIFKRFDKNHNMIYFAQNEIIDSLFLDHIDANKAKSLVDCANNLFRKNHFYTIDCEINGDEDLVNDVISLTPDYILFDPTIAKNTFFDICKKLGFIYEEKDFIITLKNQA